MAIDVNLMRIARQTLVSGSLSSAATELVLNGLVADAVYEGTLLVVAAADGGFGWQSRFVSGGSWDTGGSDYANQLVIGAGATASASAGSNSYGPIGTKDIGTPQIAPLAQFRLYTGSASRRAIVVASAAYLTTDGVNAVAGTLMSQRVTAGAIADIRFISTTTNGLGSGTRALLQRLI